MQRHRAVFIPTVIVALAFGSALAAKPSLFARVAADYEQIRQALLHDRIDGIAESATNIAQLAQDSEASLDETTAGVPAEKMGDLTELLPSIHESATALASAKTIADARESFGELSQALVRYRQMMPDPSPAVAYCPMAKKVWMQPKGEIGNPYFGQRMARCGSFVSESAE